MPCLFLSLEDLWGSKRSKMLLQISEQGISEVGFLSSLWFGSEHDRSPLMWATFSKMYVCSKRSSDFGSYSQLTLVWTCGQLQLHVDSFPLSGILSRTFSTLQLDIGHRSSLVAAESDSALSEEFLLSHACLSRRQQLSFSV